ncbi:binding partner of ACD11 1-like isoform X1 [Gossypium australe]|uniref:Binding partner of ACD11 1-like isoform X1 n=1 Tax=Gossypium australe TaxID=47621 RepID=A0A5B6VKQ6_9ROSI|nr:binding partner of ACD11 1-like isoform X1 [Gossypium australe]
MVSPFFPFAHQESHTQINEANQLESQRPTLCLPLLSDSNPALESPGAHQGPACFDGRSGSESQETENKIKTIKVSKVSLQATERNINEFFSFSGDIEYVEMQSDN